MDVATFREEGFLGPARVMSPEEAAEVLRRLDDSSSAPLNWSKGRAASHRLIYDVATRPEVIGPVSEILGSDVVLWGASVVSSPPGHTHPPHVDIETSDPAARAVTVWIGLENTSRDSGLRFVARSHRFEYPVQRAAADAKRRRGEYNESDALAWAVSRDVGSQVVVPAVADGDALWFDGQLWHGSSNQGDRTRRALLLQYASADTPIRIPDLSNFEWPFRSFDAPRPPCIVVRGEANATTNLIVPPPAPEDPASHLLSDFARSIPSPLESDASGWRPHFQFHAATSNLRLLECHVSTLAASVTPHPPHGHDEEELLVALSGSAELTYDDSSGRHIRRLAPGDIAYYAAGRAHTLRALDPGPAEYLLIKWDGAGLSLPGVMDSAVHSSAAIDPPGDAGFRAVTIFEGFTTHLDRLHCHLSVMEPGAGFEAHYDAHDVALVLLAGSLVTLGTKVVAPAIVFTSGGYLHGLHNPGSDPARYLAFEFDGRAPQLGVRAAPPPDVAAANGGGEVALTPVTPVRKARAAVWGWGGRVTARLPRVKRALRRVLRPLSPWT